MEFVQHSVHGPLASIVIQMSQSDKHSRVYLFTTENESVRKVIQQTNGQPAIHFLKWDIDGINEKLYFGGSESDGQKYYVTVAQVEFTPLGLDLMFEFKRETTSSTEFVASLASKGEYFVSVTYDNG